MQYLFNLESTARSTRPLDDTWLFSEEIVPVNSPFLDKAVNEPCGSYIT